MTSAPRLGSAKRVGGHDGHDGRRKIEASGEMGCLKTGGLCGISGDVSGQADIFQRPRRAHAGVSVVMGHYAAAASDFEAWRISKASRSAIFHKRRLLITSGFGKFVVPSFSQRQIHMSEQLP